MKHLLLSLLLLSSINNAKEVEVWLFGTKTQVFYNKHKVARVLKVKHYIVDGGRDFEAKISKNLSKNQDEARKQVRSRFIQNKELWEKEAKKRWQGAINAQSIGIEKIPAITFDNGKTVIYGVLDIVKAYSIWSNAK